MAIKPEFVQELEQLINRHSVDSYMNTPDFILAESIVEQLEGVRELNAKRDRWFNNRSLKQESQTLELDPPHRADGTEAEQKSNEAMVDELFTKTGWRYMGQDLYLNNEPDKWTKCDEGLRTTHEAWQMKKFGKIGR